MEKMGATDGVGLIVYTGTREELCRKLRDRDDYITKLEDALDPFARMATLNVPANAHDGDGCSIVMSVREMRRAVNAMAKRRTTTE